MYKVIITETLQRTIDVPQATSYKEALHIVREQYQEEQIVLSADDFFQADFEPIWQDNHKQEHFVDLESLANAVAPRIALIINEKLSK